jgi:hypothetical protein
MPFPGIDIVQITLCYGVSIIAPAGHPALMLTIQRAILNLGFPG